MSLINKMLQDLDARGQQSGDTLQPSVKSVARPDRRGPAMMLVGLALLAAAVAAAGAFGWRYYKRPAAPLPPAPRVVALPSPAVIAPAPAVVALAPSAASAATPPAASVATPPAASVATQIAASAATLVATAPAASAPPARPALAAIKAPAPGADDAPPPVKKTRKEKRAEKAKLEAEKKAAAAKKAAAKVPAAKAAPHASASAPAVNGKQLNTQQRAESEYRRALAALTDGRTAEAITAFEQALQIEPRHDAARQTLVGLLIENRRQDDAIRQLQLGLTLDPRQPALAMLLARLQIERGASGIDTLTRTLPYAAGNGEYHAFLAGALQREQRHREAAEQYQHALHTAPQNGVWWMGLGISLQAEKRNAEALDAFQKSKASGTLTPELQAFVERKLQQLSR